MSAVNIDVSTANPKQVRFFKARERYVAYGGARGGGKSWAVRMKAAMLALRYTGIRILIVRRTLPELEENHIRQMQEILRGCAAWSEQKKQLTTLNGSVIRFGYCDAERDVLRYQGQEYDCIFLDEATQLTEFQFQTFKGCLRGVNDFPKRMYVTCNPGGVGHSWVKRLFVDRDYRAGERAEEHVFIPAGIQDNLILQEKDPEYIHGLESLPYALREAWLYGNWDVLAGQFFGEWQREVHVCEPFPVPEHWRWYVTMDYGMDMLAAYLIAVDEQGRAYVCREIYEGRDLGEGHEGVIVSDAAAMLKEMTADVEVYQWLAPWDMFTARTESGRSVADIFAESGIYLTKTSNDRIAGWAAVRERLKVTEDETGLPSAMLRIFPRCVNLIRTLPLLRYDERKPSDCAQDPHELTHAPDAIRGFCVYWIEQGTAPAEEPRPDPLREVINRSKRRGKRR